MLRPTTTDRAEVLLAAHGLRRTRAAGAVLTYFLAQPNAGLSHAQIDRAMRDRAGIELDRATLYRLVRRFTVAGLLSCRTDGRGVRRYQAQVDAATTTPHFECLGCHRDQAIDGIVAHLDTQALQNATAAAMQALQAVGFRDVSVDLALRGICADCARTAMPEAR